MIKHIIYAILIFFIISVSCTQESPEEKIICSDHCNFDTSKYYIIMSVISSKVVDIPSYSTNENEPVVFWELSNGDNQKFKLIQHEDGYFSFISKHSNLCLAINNASFDSNALVVQQTFTGEDHQKFKLIPFAWGGYFIISKKSEKSLDVPGSNKDNGTNLIQWENTGNNNQRFLLKLAE